MPPQEEHTHEEIPDNLPRKYCPICHMFEPGRHGTRCAGIGEGEIVGMASGDRWLEAK